MKVFGKENGVIPMVVTAAAMVPVSSTSITALCSTFRDRYNVSHFSWLSTSLAKMDTNLWNFEALVFTELC